MARHAGTPDRVRPAGSSGISTAPAAPHGGLAVLDRLEPSSDVTRPVGLQQIEHEELFVPVVEPTAPLTPGLGYALGAGRRLRQRQLREAEDRLGPRWWESEQFAELERAVEEAFAGPMLGDDPHPTGELVRPFVDHVDGPNRAHGPVWAGIDVVPPPTPVFGIA
ncbi:MAG: hypothetical protein WAL50_09660, partial [Kineosporiaceae bacterium]